MLRPSHRALATLLAVVITLGGWAVEADQAFACTGRPVPPDDPSIAVVVLGRVTDTEYTLRPDSEANPQALWLHMTLEVDRYLRGSGASTVIIDDGSSAHAYPDDLDHLFWIGPCHAFSEDPTGKYLVAAVPADPAQFSTFTVYGLGNTPEEVQSGVYWVEAQLGLTGVIPASAGHGVEASSTPWSALGLGVLGVAVALGVSRAASGSRRAG